MSCLSAETGAVKNLSEEFGHRLAELIKHKLHSVATEAHLLLAILPHVRLNKEN